MEGKGLMSSFDIQGKQSNDEKFPTKENSQWRDLAFLVAFAVHFVGIAVIIGWGVATKDSVQSDRLFIFPTEDIGLLAILVVIALLVSALYLQLMKSFPTVMVYLGLGTSFLLFALQAAYCFATAQIAVGVVTAVFIVFFALYLFIVRSRIPFAIEMITTSVSIIQLYPGSQITAYLAMLVHILWSSLWVFTLYQASTFEQGPAIGAIIFLVFSFYWVSEVIKNVVHVTVCGVVATWYFLNGTAAMPSSPTLGSLNRAMTTSFGSICLGSLIVAVLKTIRALLRTFRRNSIVALFVVCILGALDRLVRYFNHYAFCQVAIYGKTFCTAASDTWELVKTSGIAAIANDNLIGGVLLLGCLFTGGVTGGAGALLSFAWQGWDPLVLFLVGAFIGLIMGILSLQVVDSSVACLFVCFAENPNVLKDTNPGLWQRLMEADSNLGAEAD